MALDDRFKKKHDNNNALPKPVVEEKPKVLTTNDLKRKRAAEFEEQRKQDKIDDEAKVKAEEKRVAEEKEKFEEAHKLVKQKLFNYMGNLGSNYFKGEPNLHPDTIVHLKEQPNGRILALFTIEFSIDREEMSKIVDIGKGK